MKKQMIITTMVAVMAMFGVLNVHAQGKAPWTMTKNWIYSEEDPNKGLYVDAWIFGKKAKGRCDDEPNTICNGGINVAWEGNTLYYLVLNYAGKNAKGYIYNATLKSKDSPVFTGKLLIRVKGTISSGPSLTISALTENLQNAHVDGITLIGTPTAMDE